MYRTITTVHRAVAVVACVGLLGLVGTACGADAGADAPATTAPSEGEHDGHDDEAMTITIEGVDYGFENVPDSVPSGTKLGFANTSNVELHELVAFRVETEQPLEQLFQQPPDQLEATLGAPVTVLLQPPGAPDPIVAVGDGILAEPGRYILMCFIPIGADPAEYLAAVEAAGGKKPEGVAGGPPHFTAGMFAELTVE